MSHQNRETGKRGLPKDDRACDDDGGDETKRPRKCDEQKTAIDLFSNGLITTAVCSFLDVKELLQLSSCSKFVRGHVTHSHEIVIVSATMHGGYAKKTMEALVRLVRAKQIWVPSPMRMLRLVNGERCERCNKNVVNTVEPHFGVFFCRRGCMQSYSKAERRHYYRQFTENPRIANHSGYSARFAEHKYCDQTGEVCGALVTRLDMDMPGTPSIEAILKRCDQDDPNAKHAEEIVRIFVDAQKGAEKRKREKEENKRITTIYALEKKRERIRSIVEKLAIALDDVPWKEALLAYEPNRSARNSSSTDVIRFRSSITNKLLSDVVKTPSNTTGSMLKQLRSALLSTFAVIGETNFHDFSFLSSTNPLESTLLEYYQPKYPHMEHLHGLEYKDLNLLRERKCLEVMESLFSSEPSPLRTTTVLPFDKVLAAKIASSLAYTDDGSKTNAETLALCLWKRERRISDSFHTCFEMSIKKFPALYGQAVFFATPSTEMEASNKSKFNVLPVCFSQDRLARRYFTHPDRLARIWRPTDEMLELLLERNYFQLLWKM